MKWCKPERKIVKRQFVKDIKRARKQARKMRHDLFVDLGGAHKPLSKVLRRK